MRKNIKLIVLSGWKQYFSFKRNNIMFKLFIHFITAFLCQRKWGWQLVILSMARKFHFQKSINLQFFVLIIIIYQRTKLLDHGQGDFCLVLQVVNFLYKLSPTRITHTEKKIHFWINVYQGITWKFVKDYLSYGHSFVIVSICGRIKLACIGLLWCEFWEGSGVSELTSKP